MRDLGFRRQVAENCVLGYYSASSGNFLPTFRNNQSVPEDGTVMLFRKVGNKLPLHDA